MGWNLVDVGGVGVWDIFFLSYGGGVGGVTEALSRRDPATLGAG